MTPEYFDNLSIFNQSEITWCVAKTVVMTMVDNASLSWSLGLREKISFRIFEGNLVNSCVLSGLATKGNRRPN